MCVGVCVVRGAGGEMQYSAEMLIIYLFKNRTTVDKTKGVNLFGISRFNSILGG